MGENDNRNWLSLGGSGLLYRCFAGVFGIGDFSVAVRVFGRVSDPFRVFSPMFCVLLKRT